VSNFNIQTPNRQGGFTLIELVIVIVVLGILAAIAIPRFVDLSDEAEAATCSGINGALLSTGAINLADSSTGGGLGQPGTLQDIIDNTISDGWTATAATGACTITATLTSSGTACDALTVPTELASDCTT